MTDNTSGSPITPVVPQESVSEPVAAIPYLPPLASDERTAQIMVYTPQALCWGHIVLKSMVRVNMWLRTSAAPEIIHLYNAKILLQGGTGKQLPQSFKDIHIFTNDILAYHILPPEKEPLDYDPNEPNRHLENITAMSGLFRFDGHVILSNLHNIGRYMETTHERFVSMYETEVNFPFSSSQAPLKVPQVLVKLLTGTFASKTQSS